MKEGPTSYSLLPQVKPKLLIVEDDETIRTQMKWAFAQDYEVFMAVDRSTARDIFKQEKPPVVTLDLGLPPKPGEVEEGFLTLSEIREQDAFASSGGKTAYPCLIESG